MRRTTPRSAALLGTALLLGALSPLATTSAQADPRDHGKGHGGHTRAPDTRCAAR